MALARTFCRSFEVNRIGTNVASAREMVEGMLQENTSLSTDKRHRVEMCRDALADIEDLMAGRPLQVRQPHESSLFQYQDPEEPSEHEGDDTPAPQVDNLDKKRVAPSSDSTPKSSKKQKQNNGAAISQSDVKVEPASSDSHEQEQPLTQDTDTHKKKGKKKEKVAKSAEEVEAAENGKGDASTDITKSASKKDKKDKKDKDKKSKKDKK